MVEHSTVQNELPAQDNLEATRFYGDIFGWKLEDSEWQK